jgi:hypothetical protein
MLAKRKTPYSLNAISAVMLRPALKWFNTATDFFPLIILILLLQLFWGSPSFKFFLTQIETGLNLSLHTVSFERQGQHEIFEPINLVFCPFRSLNGGDHTMSIPSETHRILRFIKDVVALKPW